MNVDSYFSLVNINTSKLDWVDYMKGICVKFRKLQSTDSSCQLYNFLLYFDLKPFIKYMLYKWFR